MRQLLIVLTLLLTMTSCMMSGRNSDEIADEGLGLVQQEQVPDAKKALGSYYERQIDDGQRNLERQITDPLV